MNFFGAETQQVIRQMMPWLALGHGIFNVLVMVCFWYQGWLGHVVRRHRLAGEAPPLQTVRRHRRLGPWLVVSAAAGFLAGVLLVLLDRGRVIVYPLHFSLGLTLILVQGAAWAASRRIRARDAAGRGRHRLLGILILCLYPLQVLAGLGVLL
ncbi:MAG: DUF4079 family protein [Thermodesulfobacteriota bacterium]